MKNDHWEVAPGVTCIRLTKGRYCLVDTVNLPKISEHRWHAHVCEKLCYAQTNITIRDDGGRRQKTAKMHHMILGIPSNVWVDHRNGNGLDNSSLFGALNIKAATPRENAQNRHVEYSSKCPGVGWSKSSQKWRSYITIHGKMFHLGLFASEEAAYSEYQKACAEIESGVFVPRVNYTSEHDGISWNSRMKKWQSYLYAGRKRYHFGWFNSEAEAIIAREEQVPRVISGEFAARSRKRPQ